jgi:protein TonB
MLASRTRPIWLRPAAIAGVTAVHAAVLLWMVWPPPSETALTAPLSVSVVPQGEPSRPSVAADGQPVAEVLPAESQSVDSRLMETPALEEAKQAKIDEQKPIETTTPATEVQVVELRPIETAPAARETDTEERKPVENTAIVTEEARPIDDVPPSALPPVAEEVTPQQVHHAASPQIAAEEPAPEELPALDIGQPSDPVSESVPEGAAPRPKETASVAPTERVAEAVPTPAETNEATRPETLAAATNRPPEAAAIASLDEAAAIATAQGIASVSPIPQASVADSVERPAVASVSTPASELAATVAHQAKPVIPSLQPAAKVVSITANEARRPVEVDANRRPTPEVQPVSASPAVPEVRPVTEAKPIVTAALPVEARETQRQPERPVARAVPPAKIAKPQRAEDVRRSAAARASSRAAPASARASIAAPAGAAAVANYRSLVVAELNRRKFYPPSAREVGTEGVVTVAFTIGSSGRVTQHAITRASGHTILDNAVNQMMARVELPPPPGGSFRAAVPIRFNISH